MQVPAPKTKQEIIAAVRAFSDAFNPSGAFPVPIDAMVERKGIFILEIPGLRRASGVAGQISNDLTEIQVDSVLFTSHLDAYRYTIAHEAAHLELHGPLISSIGIDSKQDWKQYLANQPAALNDRVETEAAIFARYVLVPDERLKAAWQSATDLLAKGGRNIDLLTDESKSVVAANIARQFQVPTWMIERRLRDEGLFE